MKSILRVELDERRFREWVREARPLMKRSRQRIHTFKRTVSAGGARALLYVAVLEHGKAGV